MTDKCNYLADDGKTCISAKKNKIYDVRCLYAINAIKRKPWCFTLVKKDTP